MEATHDYRRYGPGDWPVFVGRGGELPTVRVLGRDRVLHEVLVFGDSLDDVTFRLGALLGYLTRSGSYAELIVRGEPQPSVDPILSKFVAVVSGVITFCGGWRPIMLRDYERAMCNLRGEE